MREYKSWSPPFQATLQPFGEAEGAGALVRFKVTHMFSDGYSVLPLLADFAAAVERAEGSAAPQLPPPPCMFAAYERRLHRTVHEDASMGDVITAESLQQAETRKSSSQVGIMPDSTVSALKGAAIRLAVADEIAMLAVLLVTFARFQKRQTQPLVLIAPQRDEPASGDMIGLFADYRHFEVHTAGLSLAGVALQLRQLVESRQWSAPAVFLQYEAPWVNLMWTELESRAGFDQVLDDSRGGNPLSHPLQVCVDQPRPDEWRVSVAIDAEMYSQDERRGFFDVMETALSQLIVEPLALVWPG